MLREPVWDTAKVRFKDTTIHSIPNGSHSLPYDLGDEFMEVLVNFWERIFGISE